MTEHCSECGEPIPDWVIKFYEHLRLLAGTELTPSEMAQLIHEALEIAEAEKYATDKSCFTFGIEGISERQLAKIRSLLSPLENKIVKVERITRKN